jgi:pimeloyl-ACP methyl ester carboxylesterase
MPARKGHRRFRPVGFVLAGVVFGTIFSVTGIAALYVATTARPVPNPTGLHFVLTNGYRTRFVEAGTRSTHPIVLVHGAFESTDTWQRLIGSIPRGVHVEAFDLAGYGYSDHVGPFTTEHLAQQLASFLVARHLTDPVLVGHSLGAGVIARYVIDHHSRTGGIVFVDGDGLSASYPTWPLKLIIEPFRTALYRLAVRSDWLVRAAFSAICGPGCPPLTTLQLDQVRRPFLVAGAESAFLAYAQHPIVGVSSPERHQIATLDVPALVIVGAQDPELTRIGAATAARAIGAPAPIVLRHTGHLSMWSHPFEVARAILAFRSRLG